jgi:energy-coupling factor transporter ATP-binding protein EcfA2
LFLLFGSSGSGKTTLVDALRGCAPTLACHDFDEVGVPRRPTIAWRQRMLEQWVRRAIALQRDGVDLLLAGQSPLGELVAAPSACELDRYAACLLDCDDETRATRLRADPRGGARPRRPARLGNVDACARARSRAHDGGAPHGSLGGDAVGRRADATVASRSRGHVVRHGRRVGDRRPALGRNGTVQRDTSARAVTLTRP